MFMNEVVTRYKHITNGEFVTRRWKIQLSQSEWTSMYEVSTKKKKIKGNTEGQGTEMKGYMALREKEVTNKTKSGTLKKNEPPSCYQNAEVPHGKGVADKLKPPTLATQPPHLVEDTMQPALPRSPSFKESQPVKQPRR